MSSLATGDAGAGTQQSQSQTTRQNWNDPIFADDLRRACKEGDVELAKKLIAKGVDVNAKDKKGWTALHWASDKGLTDVVKLLLGHPKIDLNAKGSRETPLQIASFRGHTIVVNLLLQQKNLNINQQQSPLKGGGGGGDTALHKASFTGHIEIVKLLLNQTDIQVNIKNRLGYTPLYQASKFGQTEVVELLLNHPDIQVSK